MNCFGRLTLVVAFLLTGIVATSQTMAVASTEVLLNAAYTRAAKEHKKVFIIFHASWCGWCRKMDSSMSGTTCRKFFEDNYITSHLTVDESKEKENLENPGAKAFRKKYNGEGAGLPFWWILDEQGMLLADAKIRPAGAGFEVKGNNSGCPATNEEVAWFVKVLKKTSRLTEPELNIISRRFSENAVP